MTTYECHECFIKCELTCQQNTAVNPYYCPYAYNIPKYVEVQSKNVDIKCPYSFDKNK